LPHLSLIPPKKIIKPDKNKVYFLVSGKISLYAPDDSNSVNLSQPLFEGFTNPKTESLEIKNRLGRHILDMECTFENPFYAGDELYFLQINPNYLVVTKSHCIKIEISVPPLFALFQMFSPAELLLMKKKCEARIKGFLELKLQLESC